jgi:hypothetical protein
MMLQLMRLLHYLLQMGMRKAVLHNYNKLWQLLRISQLKEIFSMLHPESMTQQAINTLVSF